MRRIARAAISAAAMLTPAAAGVCAATDRNADGLPMRSGREIRFTTQEGTWLSPDLSPDGWP